MILWFPIPPGKAFFRWMWTSILLPENWVSWISPNICRDTVSKWTHRLMEEGDNLERSLYCACGGSYPRLSGGGSELIKKVSIMERLPRRFNIVQHRTRQLLHAKSPVPARVVSVIRPGPGFFWFFVVRLLLLATMYIMPTYLMVSDTSSCLTLVLGVTLGTRFSAPDVNRMPRSCHLFVRDVI